MKTVQVFVLLNIVCYTLAQNGFKNKSVEHNAYGYFKKIGIPRAEQLSREEELSYLMPRIVGGNAAEITRFNYQAGLLVSLENITGIGLCGGALISEDRVATAAHCWYDGINQGTCMTVSLGSAKVFSGGTRINTCEVYTHPKWDPKEATYDIAIVYLPKRVKFSKTIAPIALPSKQEKCKSFEGETAVASGFGRISQQTPIASNQSLSEVKLTIISNEECSLTYPKIIDDSILCTSGEGTHGHVAICGGDSGGPLVLKRHGKKMLVGVASFGSPLGCDKKLPNGFARVTFLLKFLRLHLKNK